MAGAGLLMACACAWASLISWSASDPALTSSTDAALNLLGPIGALFADWWLQCLGFAAALALFAPTTWGVDLAAGRSLPSRHQRFVVWPVSVIAAAGAVAAMPVPSGWPIPHGLGGLIGDRILAAVSGMFAAVNLGAGDALSGGILGSVAVGLSLPLLGFKLGWFGSSRSRTEPEFTDVDATGEEEFGPSLEIGPSDEPLDAPEDLPVPSLRLVASPGLAPVLTAVEPAISAPIPVPRSTVRREPAPTEVMTLRSGDDESVAEGQQETEVRPTPRVLATPRPPPQERPLHVPFTDGDWQEDEESERIARKFAFDRRRTDPGYIAPDGANVDDGPKSRLGWVPWRRRSTDIVDRVEPTIDVTDRSERRPDAPLSVSEALRQKARPVEARLPEAQPADARMTLSERARKQAAQAELPRVEPSGFQLPSTKLLRAAPQTRAADHNQTVLKARAAQLETVLAEFGIKGRIVGVRPGPVVTLYELEPAPGLKTARVVGLADDVARSMSAKSARIAAIAGRNLIGIELPNDRRETVYLRELLESDAFKRSTANLPIVIGKGIEGEPVIADLTRMPHLLIAGTTGSGKSVGVNAMILSLLFRFTPEQCRLILIDPKVLELSAYHDIPHLLTPIVTDASKAVAALGWAVTEMEERNKRMATANVRNIDTYNNRLRNAARQGVAITRTVRVGYDRQGQAVHENETLELEPMPHIVIVIDEMADLMLTAGKEFEAHVQRLAQMARAAGIHLITATQRPSVDVVTGVIKSNLPARLSYRVASKIDSRTVLNEQGAEHLLGAGDLLFNPGSGTIRAHGPYVADEEVAQVTAELRRYGSPVYVDAVVAAADPADADAADDDDLYDRAVTAVLSERKISVSLLQRRLKIGYNRAAACLERMQQDGIISAPEAGPRRILIDAAPSA